MIQSIVPIKNQKYLRVGLNLDVEPHDNIPMIWRVNGGSFKGLTNGARERDKPYKFVSIFVDVIFRSHSWKIKKESPGMVYAEFLYDFLSVFFHEYVHHFIDLKFIGYEKTKVDPAADAIVRNLVNQDNYDEWVSWWNIFEDCYEFLAEEKVKYDKW